MLCSFNEYIVMIFKAMCRNPVPCLFFLVRYNGKAGQKQLKLKSSQSN